MPDEQHMVVVLAVYNEADSITAVLAEVHEAAGRLRPTGVRTSVVLVDDESPDETGDLAVDFAGKIGLPLYLVRGRREGLGSAMLRGLTEALKHSPDQIVTLDGDGQHNPADIPTLHRAFTARRADIVVGSRWTRGGSAPGTSRARVAGSRFGNLVFRAITGTRGVRDATTSFRVYSPRVVRFLLSIDSKRYSGYSFFSTTVALAEAAGYSITEVPIEFRPRYSGQSKLNRREAWRYFSTLGSLREERRSQAGQGHEAPYRATDEIELLSMAKGWNRFVVHNALVGVAPSEVRHIVEVGAGLGGVTTVLAERFPNAAVVSIEPDEANYTALKNTFPADGRLCQLSGTLSDHQVAVKNLPPDVVLYVNVLEHILDDAGELKRAADVLPSGGVLSIFVPALHWLYGPIDAKSGHFRRYSLDSLREVVENAGFDVKHIRYVDRLGIGPYWWNYRVLNKSGISRGSVWAFDRVFVPTMRLADEFLRSVPFGKNLVCVARRRPTGEDEVPEGVYANNFDNTCDQEMPSSSARS